MEAPGTVNLSLDYSATAIEYVCDPLSELGRATTAYHDAPPERLEHARIEYEIALRKFKMSLAGSD